jgi:hypothetical protein
MFRTVALLFFLMPQVLFAQAIDRIKLTDSELTCVQIYSEINEMNAVMGIAKEDRDSSGNAATAAGLTHQATGVAAHAAAMSGSLGAAVGLAQAAPILGLFGSAAKGVADAKQRESAERMADAKARKEHLTGLFVSKACKLSDVAPSPAAAEPAKTN